MSTITLPTSVSSIPGLFSLQRMPPPLLFQAIVRVRAIDLLFLGLGLGGKVRVKMLIIINNNNLLLIRRKHLYEYIQMRLTSYIKIIIK